MPIPLKLKVFEEGPTPRKYARQLKDCNLFAARQLGEHFHEVNLPRRFTVAGGIMLGYAARSSKYNAWKERALGYRHPNVKSGETRDNVLRHEDIRESGSSRRWRVNIILRARGVNRYRNKKGTIKPADEIRRVAKKEEGPLARVFERFHNQRRDEIK